MDRNVLRPNPPGRPIELNQEIVDRVLSAIPKAIVPGMIAGLSRVPRQTLCDWLRKGERDFKQGIDSIYARLFDRFKEEQSKICVSFLEKLQTCPRNYGAITFLLSKCFKEDFEDLPEDIKWMLDYFIKELKPLMDKGELPHGREEEIE